MLLGQSLRREMYVKLIAEIRVSNIANTSARLSQRFSVGMFWHAECKAAEGRDSCIQELIPELVTSVAVF